MKFSVTAIEALPKLIPTLLLAAVMGFGSSAPQSNPKQVTTKANQSSKKTATRKQSSKSRKTHAGSRKGKRSKRASWRHSQQRIDSARARQIQEALIREHYLSGEPSGKWDQRSQAAMVRFQAANGWQTKIVPDSRALIKLGLGPNHDDLLNPESAMTGALQPSKAAEHTSSATADAAPVNTAPVRPTPAGSAEPARTPQK